MKIAAASLFITLFSLNAHAFQRFLICRSATSFDSIPHAGTKEPSSVGVLNGFYHPGGSVPLQSDDGITWQQISKVAPYGYGYLLDVGQAGQQAGVVKESLRTESMQSRIVCEHTKYGNYLYIGGLQASLGISSARDCLDLVSLLNGADAQPVKIIVSDENLILDAYPAQPGAYCNRTRVHK